MSFSEVANLNWPYWVIFLLGLLNSGIDVFRRFLAFRTHKGRFFRYSTIRKAEIQYLVAIFIILFVLFSVAELGFSFFERMRYQGITFLGLLLAITFLPRVLDLQFMAFDANVVLINNRKIAKGDLYWNSDGQWTSFRKVSDSSLLAKIPNRFLEKEMVKTLLVTSGIPEK